MQCPECRRQVVKERFVPCTVRLLIKWFIWHLRLRDNQRWGDDADLALQTRPRRKGQATNKCQTWVTRSVSVVVKFQALSKIELARGECIQETARFCPAQCDCHYTSQLVAEVVAVLQLRVRPHK